MPRPTSPIKSLLEELCVHHGYCLPSGHRARLLTDPPPTVDAFADAVLRSEGLDPALDKVHRRDARPCIERWFARL